MLAGMPSRPCGSRKEGRRAVNVLLRGPFSEDGTGADRGEGRAVPLLHSCCLVCMPVNPARPKLGLARTRK